MARPLTLLVPAALLLGASSAHALDLAPLRALDGTVANGQFGIAVVVVGDMDGDGFADYAVGASADSTAGPGAGRVFIYRGGPQHVGDPPAWVISGQPGDLLGAALAPAGDLDGDGLADLLIGAPAGTTVNPALPGRVLIAYGSSTLGARAVQSIDGPLPGGRFGAAVAGLHDFDGDGRDDFAVGAPAADGNAGLVAVFAGGAPLAATPRLVLHGAAAGDRFGAAVAGAGHTRGGALADLLVGAPFNSQSAVWGGRAYLYLGGAPPDTAPAMQWGGAGAGDLLGSALAGVGDVNGDGFDDFAIGSPGADADTLIEAGRAQLFLGGASPPAAAADTVIGTIAYGELGLAVAGVGDVDADGYADWAAGTPGSPDVLTAGTVSLMRGRSAPSSTPDTVLAGEVVGDMFGRSISNGGLVDAGRHALFLVGADAHGAGGGAYLYGSSMATLAVAPAAASAALSLAPAPNPARGRADIRFALPAAAAARLELIDPAGRRVRALDLGALGPGAHAAALETAGLGPGVYVVRLAAGRASATARLVVMR